MKISKLLKTALAAAALTALLTIPSLAASCGGGTVTASSLNVRTEPSTSADIRSCIPRGTAVVVGDRLDGWYRIWYKGIGGYVSADFLTFSDSLDSQFGYGTIDADSVRLRDGASLSSATLGYLNTGAKMTVTGVSGEWYRVSYDGKTGYVNSGYVSLTPPDEQAVTKTENSVASITGAASISADSVRVRAGASLSANTLGYFNKGAGVNVTGSSGNWYIIDYNGGSGYVYSSYVTTGSVTSDESSEADRLISLAKSYMGVSYVYGGTTPSGFDCTGFTYYLFKQLGYTLYRCSQYNNGVAVDRANLQKGDLVLFYDSGMNSFGHVGIYIGDNTFIHSSSGAGKVVVTSLTGWYDTHYMGARRVLS